MEINNPDKRRAHFDPLPETEEITRPKEPETRLQPVTIPAHQLRPFLQAGGRILSLVKGAGVNTLAFKGELANKHEWNGNRGPFILILSRDQGMMEALLKTMAEVEQQRKAQGAKGSENDDESDPVQ